MPQCSQCDSEMTLAPLGPIEGEEHGVRLKIDGLPALQCPNGHRRFVAPTFPMKLLDQMLAAPPLVPLDAAVEKGWLRRRYRCPACGEVLDEHGAGRVEAERAVELEGWGDSACMSTCPCTAARLARTNAWSPWTRWPAT